MAKTTRQACITLPIPDHDKIKRITAEKKGGVSGWLAKVAKAALDKVKEPQP